ncbi:MAG TPA: gamma-glutamyl-gamma-aminobutyrate hydrolase family protein [Thermoleophilaceae bacterium]|nr:gamma-glutamyl-gamma-aminobutyrate hydrolase family protein [Thermoleophilaceae bacterium]
MSRRPVIGICSAIEEVSWGGWTVLANVSPRSYTLTVQAAGGMALLLPPDDAAAEQPADMLDLIDGLILAGGSDVDPGSYGAVPHPETRGTWPERDRFELGLTHAALERDMPVLGICRGMQLLNVALGGTLVQHLPDVIGHNDHRHTVGTFGDHEVRLEEGTLAARAVGGQRASVKSHHHQGVDELGERLVAVGWSEADDQIEAIELPDRAYALGVLWHPEEDERSNVIGSLVKAAT